MCCPAPSSFGLLLELTRTPGPPAPIKGAVIAACQRRPQAPLLKKKCCGRWTDKGSMKSCRNERGSFQSTVKMQESFHAELEEMKECHHLKTEEGIQDQKRWSSDIFEIFQWWACDCNNLVNFTKLLKSELETCWPPSCTVRFVFHYWRYFPQIPPRSCTERCSLSY